MKIYYNLPNGGEFYYESEPRERMPKERFEAICWLVGILGGAALFVISMTSLCR